MDLSAGKFKDDSVHCKEMAHLGGGRGPKLTSRRMEPAGLMLSCWVEQSSGGPGRERLGSVEWDRRRDMEGVNVCPRERTKQKTRTSRAPRTVTTRRNGQGRCHHTQKNRRAGAAGLSDSLMGQRLACVTLNSTAGQPGSAHA